MKIYIAGKISGLPYDEVRERFNNKKKELLKEWAEVSNPIEISPYIEGKRWSEYMRDCIREITTCDAVYFMNGWEDSNGARAELEVARVLGLEIIYED